MNIILIQSRLTSSRLPSKALLKIGNKTIIDIINKRLEGVKGIDKIINVIPDTIKNKKLKDYLNSKNLNVFIGSENNVLDRFYKAAEKVKADNIIRITGDCPFLDKNLIQKMLKLFLSRKYDYLSNTIKRTFPDGLDVEIFKFSLLEKTWKKAKNNFDKEHVTPLMLKLPNIKKFNYENKKNLSSIRLTLDNSEDYQTFRKIYKKFNFNFKINWNIVTKFYSKNFKVITNRNLLGDDMTSTKTKKMWIKATKVIPEGNLMISKNPNLFGEKKWPSHFLKSKGCFIWDLDKIKYTDCSLMGVGTNILGYSNTKINSKVLEVIRDGNISSLNSFEEVKLAEKLLSFNKWAGKVLFARTGADANAISVRLARLYSGKDKIAICGYHGWHDWFLSSSKANEKKIREKFLPYYSNLGIPKGSLNSVVHFEYNDISSLENILASDKNIGAIKMEVLRNEYPKNNFLQKVKKLSEKYNKVLIFDECTTGFRENLGGIYKKFNVIPDILILGKAMGNGYPITCVIGVEEIMKLKNKSFISSTFWTDRIGPTAALETINIMEKEKTWKKITKTGKKVKKFWQSISNKYKLPISTKGIPALVNYSFDNNKYNLMYRSYLINYLLKKNFLSGNIFYSSTAHTDLILKKYFELLEEGFFNLRKSIDNGSLFDSKEILKTFKTFR